ncbi:DNA-binding GntR family transcriptional regulator [Nocardioides zeae]|uniref:DNA-binding GntR family transcriptional regulator n=2 Tax=Nocardioides zeae TaxID=1457234 RepID=A0ACC6IKA5_9ACTN|nr:GntR family transcriptional regulator [Nocardioides zeae]MDQ1106829.1 DNA-binding GntR family transcriptional regulator [Nocardioides zeae]MDR6173516.1 DNA-binding GntR family transcriptional regulator [Nocardioides zeae]MDR6210922.1 DNA-binding GntR family transcriptional regulator [Nocardioides zeae]
MTPPADRASHSPRRRSVFTSRLTRTGPDGPARVLDDVRDAILRGDEPPGTVIPIDAVARFFGVSTIPVREALKVLSGEGLVEHTPHVGYSVAKLTYPEFRELYDVRQALESSALRAAVRHATEDDVALVSSVHAEMDAALAAQDERAYHLASRRFHLLLIEPSGMQRLVHMYAAAWNMTEPARPMARVPAAGRATFVHDHAAMLAAYVARDADLVVARSDAHYDHLREGIATFADDPDVFRVPSSDI